MKYKKIPSHCLWVIGHLQLRVLCQGPDIELQISFQRVSYVENEDQNTLDGNRNTKGYNLETRKMISIDSKNNRTREISLQISVLQGTAKILRRTSKFPCFW